MIGKRILLRNMEYKLTEADYVFHRIMHSDYSIEEGMKALENNDSEKEKLWQLLHEAGEIPGNRN